MNAPYWSIQYSELLHHAEASILVQNAPKSLAGGAYSAPPDPLAVMGWDGDLVTTFLGCNLCAPSLVAGAPLLFWGWLRAWSTMYFWLISAIVSGVNTNSGGGEAPEGG